MLENTIEIEKVEKKELYAYQQKDIDAIFERIDHGPKQHHLLYQLPTGGGKTVIFSEIVRRYIAKHNKKVVVLTHRIELCKQTSKMLKGFGVKGIRISPIHANFFEHDGTLSDWEVISFLEKVKSIVQLYTGIELEFEVQI